MAMSNVGHVLRAAGMDYGNVVSCHVQLADMGQYKEMNEVYGSYFGIVQPLRPLKTVDLHFELQAADGSALRVPERGVYRMTVGRPGLRLVEA